MLQSSISKTPCRKLHKINTSYVLTIDPSHIERLKADDIATFFEQEPVEGGILLRMRRLS